DTAANYSTNKTLTQLFEEQAAQTPNNIAVIFQEKTYSYSTLNQHANRLAHYLQSKYNIQPNDLIGIQLEKSEWMIISILGALKSGGAYLPIDPSYPQERINYIIEDSKCKLVINQKEIEKFKKEANNYTDNNLPNINTPTDLAYVIYTSGSTGQPKGCMLEHRGVINRIEWMYQQYNFSTADIILQKTNFTFDVSVWEIFMPLCWGTKMVLCQKEDIGSPERILKLIHQYKITCLHFVPSMLNAFMANIFNDDKNIQALSSVTKLITSGEALSVETVKNWYAKTNIPIHNLYGPTEASIDVTHYTTSQEDTIIPIGRPIWNTQMYIIDKHHHLLPIGAVGEICISGDGLARGYLNKAELTKEKFVDNPFKPGSKMYKT
ncbi:MAG TPA: amino acid adenylation domain-containing protein, partial [Chitinophagaceae bacterium]|nr:amino acid adenylation domain-containing protein [Chitinophagaceae bacterium]